MIEIAIALAVIAFALVAIIGVLPTGLSVQKDNREDTIINQDGPYWMQAIRNGSRGLDHLTNFVETITVHTVGRSTDVTTIFTNSPGANLPLPYDGSMTNGQRIVGLLSKPKYFYDKRFNRFTNTVTARVRAMTGAAVEQGRIDTTESALTDFSFSYFLEPEITPFAAVQVNFDSTNYCDSALTPDQVAARKVEWIKVQTRELNASEVRLVFKWPLLAGGRTGPNRQIFREIVSGEHKFDQAQLLHFFQPQTFAVSPPPPDCP